MSILKQKKFIFDPFFKGLSVIFLIFGLVFFLVFHFFDFILNKKFIIVSSKNFFLKKSKVKKNENEFLEINEIENNNNFISEKNFEKSFLSNRPTLSDNELNFLYEKYFSKKIKKKEIIKNEVKSINLSDLSKKNENKKLKEEKKEELLEEKKIEKITDLKKENKNVIVPVKLNEFKNNEKQALVEKELKFSNSKISKLKSIENKLKKNNENDQNLNYKNINNKIEFDENKNNFLKKDEKIENENCKILNDEISIDFENESDFNNEQFDENYVEIFKDFVDRVKKNIKKFPGKKYKCEISFSTKNGTISNILIIGNNNIVLPKAYEAHLMSIIYRIKIPNEMIEKNIKLII